MIANAKKMRQAAACACTAKFLLLLPRIQEQARFAFRHEGEEQREELIVEVVANCWAAYGHRPRTVGNTDRHTVLTRLPRSMSFFTLALQRRPTLSHNVTVKTQIRDPAAIQAACQRRTTSPARAGHPSPVHQLGHETGHPAGG